MTEKPFKSFDEIEIPEEEMKVLKNGIKPLDSDIDISEEGLNQDVREVVLEISEKDFKMIEALKKALLEKIVSVSVVKEINDFAIALKEKYGNSVYDSAIYCALIGGTIENSHVVEDFEGNDSIINFVENL